MWMIAAAILVALGMIMFAASLAANGWDFKKLGTEKYETNTYPIGESFGDISIHADTADLIFAPADDGECRVVCHEQVKVKHAVSVQNGILTIEAVDTREWYEHINISFESPKITVYLPEKEYGVLSIRENTGDIEIPVDCAFESIDVESSTGDINACASASAGIKIKTSTGDIRVENVTAEKMELSVSTGDVTVSSASCVGDITVGVSTGYVTLNDVSCKNVSSTGSTGDILLRNTIVSGNMSIQRSTGDVKFENCDAGELTIKTSTGNVRGSLLSEKIFIARSDTGKIDVPQTTAGGKCEINTSTGNITIELD